MCEIDRKVFIATLKSAMAFANQDATRARMHGVCWFIGSGWRVEATDGHTAFVSGNGQGKAGVLVTLQDCERLVRLCDPKRSAPVIVTAHETEGLTFDFTHDKVTVGQTGDHGFPDIAKVWPSGSTVAPRPRNNAFNVDRLAEPSDVAPTLNPEYIERAAKALKAVGKARGLKSLKMRIILPSSADNFGPIVCDDSRTSTSILVMPIMTEHSQTTNHWGSK
jgi:hypothetical protein